MGQLSDLFEYGSILPFKKNRKTGDVSFSADAGLLGSFLNATKMPGEAYGGLRQIFDPQTGHVSQDTLRGAFDLAGAVTLGAGALPASRNTLRAGASMMRSADDIPMDQASRMARAKDMGFDIDNPVYHGTPKVFDEFDPSLSDSARQTGTPHSSFVFSDDPMNARTYAGRNNKLEWAEEYSDGGNVLPAYIRSKNPLEVEVKGEMTADKFFDFFQTDLPDGGEWAGHINELAQYAKDNGYDSLKVNGVVDSAGGYYTPQTTTFVFDPSNIRSKFAKFDPSKKDSRNLMAGVSGAVALGAAASPSESYAAQQPNELGDILANALKGRM